jgi:ATP-dependent Clp protease ATP-binding subunit ClpC
VLFDEIEKAHPDVFNTLLQILEDGHLTDAQGHKVDFKNTVIIMTSNLGTRDIQKGAGIGFASKPDASMSYERMKDKVMDELKRSFRRSSSTASTRSSCSTRCPRDDVKNIVDLMMKRVTEQLRSKDVEIELSDAAKDLLPRRATTPRWARGRCAARSSGGRGPALGEAPVEGVPRRADDHRRRPDGEMIFEPSPAPPDTPPVELAGSQES